MQLKLDEFTKFVHIEPHFIAANSSLNSTISTSFSCNDWKRTTLFMFETLCSEVKKIVL